MKKVLLFAIILSSFLWASNNATSEEEEAAKRKEKHIQQMLKDEDKFSKEQKFYQDDNYDFKGSEADQESADALPDIEIDDLDMNMGVYSD